jgi:hypothetical protein
VKIDELALEEASAKLLRLRLTDVGGRKERPSETVKSVLKRGLGGMYDDQAVMYILRHGLQYYQSAQQTLAPDVLARCKKCNALIETTVHCDNCGTFEPTRG